MKSTRRKLLGFLLLLWFLAGALLWRFYEYMPWVGTHLAYAQKDAAGGFVLNMSVSEGSEVRGGAVGLSEAPQLSRNATIAVTLSHRGQKSGSEVLQTLKPEALESIQYSWEQKNTKDLLASTWEARLGPHGGLVGLQIRPPNRSLWMRPEVCAPWLQAIWPPLVARGVDPKAQWSSQLVFAFQPDGLPKPVQAHWDCTWTFRGVSESGAGQLAILDLQGHAAGEQPVDGALRAEVAFSLSEGRVMASRGAYQFRSAVHQQVGQGSEITALSVLQGQFQLARLVAGQTSSPAP